MNAADVVAAWNEADPSAIHPLRALSEEAYWDSGLTQAVELGRVLPRDGTILDFGCGDGRVAIPLHALGFNVIGVDSSPNMIQALRARDPNLPCLVSDGSNLDPDLEPQIDAAYCLAVLIHHDYAGGRKIIENLAGIVEPGGILILDWPTGPNPTERRSWTEVTTWSPGEQQRVVDDLGLRRLGDTNLPYATFEVLP